MGRQAGKGLERQRVDMSRITLPILTIMRGDEQAEPEVVVNLREESSIDTLAAQRMLSADQVDAAWHFRRAWEAAADLRRPSRLFERVDYSRAFMSQECIEREDEARQELARCRQLLGAHGFDLVVSVCAEGHHIRDLYATRRERDTASDILRVHLTSLAAMWR
jgi:hypothetical protein